MKPCRAPLRHVVGAKPDLQESGNVAPLGVFREAKNRALPVPFAAGASHYGIADAEALARDTHKFESRYLDSIVRLTWRNDLRNMLRT